MELQIESAELLGSVAISGLDVSDSSPEEEEDVEELLEFESWVIWKVGGLCRAGVC